MKRFILKSILLGLLLMTGLTSSAYYFKVDGIYYNISGSTAYVTYESEDLNSYSGDVVIPNTVTYNGTTYTVTAVGTYAFMNSSGLTSVVIGDNVTSIGQQAFYNCEKLESVTVGSSVVSISNYAWGECPLVSSITLPETVTTLGTGVFYHCYSLAKTNIPSGVTSMGTHTFNSCYPLDSIFLPDGVTTVPGYTFYDCTSLKTVTVGSKITSVEASAFYGCSSLPAVDLPETVTSIASYGFAECSSLSALELSNSLTSIGVYAFRGAGLESIEVPSSVTSFSSGVFKNCAKLVSATLGDNITTVGTYTFDSCTVLKNVTLAPKTTTISAYAFRACEGLETIELPSSLTSIGASAFRGCSSLKEIDIPADVPKVTSYVFQDCSSLAKVTINSSETQLSSYSFYYCDSIREIYCKASDAPSCSTSAFKGTTVPDSATLYVPIGSKETYAAATGWSAFANIVEMDFSGTSTTYWLSGTYNSWSTADSDDYAFTNNGDGTHSLSLKGFYGEFKIVTTGGTTSYGYGTINLDTSYDLSTTGDNITISGYTTSTLDATFDITEGDSTLTLTVSATEVITLNGEGTEASPYLISTADEWNALARYMKINNDSLTGKYVKITANIDFTGTTVQQLGYNRKEIFNGDLDGNGMTISGIAATADADCFGGLIISAGSSACIHDLTVSGSVTSAYQYAAGVIGELYGTAYNVTSNVEVSGEMTYTAGLVAHLEQDATLTACVNEGAVTSSGLYAAGLVARAEPGIALTNCGNNASVTYTGVATTAYVAGLLSYGTNYCSLSGCYNTGAVSATNIDNSGYAAGILAYASVKSAENDKSNTSIYAISGCYNTGAITSGFYNAGIVCTGSTYARFDVEDCYNAGAVTSSYETLKSSTYTAGIAAGYGLGSTYRNCYNTGTITSAASIYNAGIAGCYLTSPSSTLPTTFSNCYNEGSISGSGNFTGGIVAYAPSNTTVDSCYNTAAVASDYTVGGIVGCMTGTSSAISNCYNTGKITAKQNAGGIVGNTVLKSTISNCYNTGAIQASTYRAGGIAGDAASAFINVYNAGTVTGANYVGGIVGCTDAGKTTISNSYSSGTVSSTGVCGNIVGISTSDTLYWTDGNSIENVYYLSGNDAGGTDAYSTGLTYAQLAAIEIDGFDNGDDYTYPLVATVPANDYAKVAAAAIVPADGDTYDYISHDFYVGVPDGAVWTASRTYVTIEGNKVTFTKTYSGNLTMTITCGEASQSTKLTCYVKELDGIDGIGSDGREIVEEHFYNTSGVEVSNPDGGSKAVYIVVRTYDDGTTSVAKEAR